MTRELYAYEVRALKTAHRRVPMPAVPPGVCRWCERTIVGTKGKYIGRPNPNRSWCRGEGERHCWREFLRHSDLAAQYGFIAHRDGEECAQCRKESAPHRWYRDGRDCYNLDWSRGTSGDAWLRELWNRDDAPDCRWLGAQCPITQNPGLEVDHITPLWKVALMVGLTVAQRRWYFGPGNLQLLCRHHHHEKSRDEAAERAALKRRPSGQ